MALKQGPWGQEWGDIFNTGEVTQITGLKVWSQDIINGIQFHYKQGEQRSSTPVYGSEKGVTTEKLFGNEVLTGVAGTFDKKEDSYAIHSLTFTTNYGQHQYSYGTPGSNKFDFQSSTSSVVGFFGNREDKINAIGLYLKTVP